MTHLTEAFGESVCIAQPIFVCSSWNQSTFWESEFSETLGQIQGAAQPQRVGGRLLLFALACVSGTGKSLPILGEAPGSPFGCRATFFLLMSLSRKLKH